MQQDRNRYRKFREMFMRERMGAAPEALPTEQEEREYRAYGTGFRDGEEAGTSAMAAEMPQGAQPARLRL